MELTIFFSLALIAFSIYQYNAQKKSDQEDIAEYDEKRKETLKKMISERQTLTNFDEANENEFWELIDKISKRANESHLNHLGLFKDYMVDYSPEQLIHIHNILYRLHKEAFHWNILGASAIMLTSTDLTPVSILTSALISKGQVVFNQSIENPNLIANQEFLDLANQTHIEIVEDLYVMRTGQLFPLREENWDVQGESWTQKDLPVRFHALWNKFG